MTSIFIITSTLFPPPQLSGTFTPEIRFNQTLETIDSVKKNCENIAEIIIVDSSNVLIPQEWQDQISLHATLLINTLLYGYGKQYGDIYNTIHGLEYIANKYSSNIDFIYKVSGRYLVNENFKLHYTKHPAKYLFRKYICDLPDWKAVVYLSNLWGIPFDKLREIINILRSIEINNYNPDFEHALYNIFSNKLDDRIELQNNLGLSLRYFNGNGTLEHV